MEWDDQAATWDDDASVRAYAEAALASLEDELRRRNFTLSGARVCDFGCGTGLLTEAIADSVSHVDAVDLSTGMLETLRGKVLRHGWTHVDTHREIPVDGPTYDLVVCSSVCGFFEDYPSVVVQLTRCLRPGGLFVQWDWEFDMEDAEPYGLSRDAIREALTCAGLSAVTVDTGFSIPAGDHVMSPLMGVGQVPAEDVGPPADVG